MSTQIKTLDNQSDTPAAYLGRNDQVPTHWAAWGFGSHARYDFDWAVETHRESQALLTKNGVYYVWDDGDWNIRCLKAGTTNEFVLVHVNAVPFQSPAIQLTVGPDGSPSANQIN
jgi:hypothetical protein